MIKSVIKKGSYQDSVVLMLLTNRIAAMEGVNRVSIMMATPANKEMYDVNGLATPELASAGPNDMAIVADVESEGIMDKITQETECFLNSQSTAGTSGEKTSADYWDQALKLMPDADLAVISVPGMYAAEEASRALDEGMNVFIFSDNVPLEDEIQLKSKAHHMGLLVMGPDCGTAVLGGIPVAFANRIKRGNIGIAGASGTGIQELLSIISRSQEGISHAIGTGGRDLKEEVGGVTMLDAIRFLEQDEQTKVLVVISKPPAPSVRKAIIHCLSKIPKPVVTLFLGEEPNMVEDGEQNIYQAYTLEEAALTAVSLLRAGQGADFQTVRGAPVTVGPDIEPFLPQEEMRIKGYYSGGTLAEEAAILLSRGLGLVQKGHGRGHKLDCCGHEIFDLGDDIFTRGTPHPMIVPEKRLEWIWSALEDEKTGVVLFDVVLGFGACSDMAGALSQCIREIKERCRKQGRRLYFVADLCGTPEDIQGYGAQKVQLEKDGVIVCESNRQAVLTALALIGRPWIPEAKKEPDSRHQAVVMKKAEESGFAVSKQMAGLFSGHPPVINIGLKGFGEVLSQAGCSTLQFNWRPPAGGNRHLIKAVNFLSLQKRVKQGNQEVIRRVISSSPVLMDVTPAMESIPELNTGMTLLHAGPPIQWENMPSPMQGSCIGAVLFEGWAKDQSAAREMLEQGSIRFIPCHHVNAVGPMGGITSPHMPVFAVKCQPYGNMAYCTMNEGIGRVLRFGAYSEEVIERLNWMRDVLGPTLKQALKAMEGGLAVNPLIAKAIAMGDEFHQRNIAASLAFLKEVGPIITSLDIDREKAAQVIKFLSDTDQFFLNIMMASAKAVMDSARTITEGTVVTAMCRNGENFGIRISGMGNQWFTAPVNIPQGLYFTGFTGKDASPDMGDSAITETFGVGGMAMVAAPAVTRFVGTGGFEDAVRTSNQMAEICLGHNPNFPIPTWNFQGTCLGIDACRVVEKGITPVINTGIAHRIAGNGQIGAGTVRPPMECFEKAVMAYMEKLAYGQGGYGEVDKQAGQDGHGK